jgi:hypothetical protein
VIVIQLRVTVYHRCYHPWREKVFVRALRTAYISSFQVAVSHGTRGKMGCFGGFMGFLGRDSTRMADTNDGGPSPNASKMHNRLIYLKLSGIKNFYPAIKRLLSLRSIFGQ